MTAMIATLISYLVVYLLVTCTAVPLLNIVLGTLNSWVGYAFFFEGTFNEDIEKYFNLEGVCNAIYSFAIAFLVLCFITRLIKVYFSWSGGDPETSPMTVLVGFLKALIVMIGFGVCYEYFVTIIYDMYEALIKFGFLKGINTSDLIDLDGIEDMGWAIVGAIVIFVVALQLLLVYIGVLTRGLQMLILRLGIAFAAIGLLNADGGVFKNYIKKFLQTGFTVLVQIFLSYLSVALIGTGNYILALIAASTALKGASLLQEFLGGGSGAFGEQGLMNAAATANQAGHMIGSAAGMATHAVMPAAKAATAFGQTAGSRAAPVAGKVGSAAGTWLGGTKVGGAAKKFGGGISNLASKAAGSKPGQALSKAGQELGNFGKDFRQNYNDISAKLREKQNPSASGGGGQSRSPSTTGGGGQNPISANNGENSSLQNTTNKMSASNNSSGSKGGNYQGNQKK